MPDDALGDVENLILLLSDLNLVAGQNDQIGQSGFTESAPSIPAITKATAIAKNSSPSLSKGKIPQELPPVSTKSSISYPFPSLLDELPFLKDIPPAAIAKEDAEHLDPASPTSQNTGYSDSNFEANTVHLLQNLLIAPEISDLKELREENLNSQVNIEELFDDPPISGEIPVKTNTDIDALQLLQDILVSPELADLRNFQVSMEEKLQAVESQISSSQVSEEVSELKLRLELAEAQISDPKISLEISELEKRLQLAERQINDPRISLEINQLAKRLQLAEAQISDSQLSGEVGGLLKRLKLLEHRIYQPDALIQLLLPVISQIISLKAMQSREEMCRAVMPIIAEVIFERSQLDRIAMSRAIADIIPNAISEQIHNNPDAIATAIAPEIGSAIREQIRLDRDAIVNAIAPEMGAAIKQQITLERDSMVDALYPVIGSTISKYFAEAIRSINEKVEQTFSAEGIQRKFRAKMRGISEAELILQEAVSFEVQAIFLIHNLSGLVMVDIQKSDLDADTEAIDSDMLAGMLTAIRSFASECMSRSTSEIDEINYSGSKILLEVAGYCYLAVIIRGEPNPEFVKKIRQIFENLVQAHGDRFKEFDGDPATIPDAVALRLQTLIQKEDVKTTKKSPKTLKLIFLALFILIGMPLAISRFVYNPQSPRSYQPSGALQSADFQLAIATYQITETLNSTQGININAKLLNGQVTITGTINQPRFLPRITQAYTQIQGIKSVVNATTLQIPQLTTRIYFRTGSTTLQPKDLSKLVEVKTFLDLYPDYDLQMLIKNDLSGDLLTNSNLARKRIQSVKSALIQQGASPDRLHFSGIIEKYTASPDEAGERWVEFAPMLRTSQRSQ